MGKGRAGKGQGGEGKGAGGGLAKGCPPGSRDRWPHRAPGPAVRQFSVRNQTTQKEDCAQQGKRPASHSDWGRREIPLPPTSLPSLFQMTRRAGKRLCPRQPVGGKRGGESAHGPRRRGGASFCYIIFSERLPRPVPPSSAEKPFVGLETPVRRVMYFISFPRPESCKCLSLSPKGRWVRCD